MIWQEEDLLFKDVDFDCLLETRKYRKRRTECMVSNFHLIQRKNTIINAQDKTVNRLMEYHLYNDYYSRISNRPFGNNFFPLR